MLLCVCDCGVFPRGVGGVAKGVAKYQESDNLGDSYLLEAMLLFAWF